MQRKRNIIHVTHEAGGRPGGVGAFLEGLLTSRVYLKSTERSLIVGPLEKESAPAEQRLGPNGKVLYSSLDGLIDEPYRRAFADVERKFRIKIVYGQLNLHNAYTDVTASPEVILIDTSRADLNPVNAFKAWLYEDFGIESYRYESDAAYERYVTMAPAAVAILRALGVSTPQHPALLVAHEHTGMPTVLAGIMDPLGSFKTVYYAHEVASVRSLVEYHPGHDTMFQNTRDWALDERYYFEEVFGPHENLFQHVLVSAAANCDNVIGVSENTLRELRFLGPQFGTNNVDLVYNGVNAQQISLAEKVAAGESLRQYAQNLLGWRPDHIFSHVARLNGCKALWRDLAVLHHLEPLLAAEKRTAVCFVLSTDAAPRSPECIRALEAQYNWPVEHGVGAGDLTEAEGRYYQSVQYFNEHHRQIRVVFVNQFGWSRAACGERMPEEMTFAHLRRGTDVEFGQSIYEAFGLSTLEPLTFGALCVPSSACGCSGFIKALTAGEPEPNVIIADYADLDRRLNTAKSLLGIDRQARDAVEARVAHDVAERIHRYLPRDEKQIDALLGRGYELASHMTWDQVCEHYLIPALEQAYHNRRKRRIA